jgi:hypothetical protein
VYAAIILPNKPENVLGAAVMNTIQQQQVSYKGVAETTASQGAVAAKATFEGGLDTAAKAGQLKISLTAAGATIPADARLVNKNIYMRVGDLGPVVDIADASSPILGDLAKSLNTLLANQWIGIDSALLDQAGASCVFNPSWSFTQADMKLFKSQYLKQSFITIKSHAGDTVNGKKVTKFALSIDNDKEAKYLSSLSGLSLAKALAACGEDAGVSTDTAAVTKKIADHGHTPVTVWVDKASKQIVQVGGDIINTDTKKSEGTVKVGLSYDTVTVAAPENSKPFMEVLGEVQATLQNSGIDPASLFSGASILQDLGIDPAAAIQASAQDIKRQTDIHSLQAGLETFRTQKGYYPTLAQLNDPSWRTKNLTGLTAATLKDPQAAGAAVAAAPGLRSYAYQPIAANKAACTGAAKCTGYSLTAILQNG